MRKFNPDWNIDFDDDKDLKAIKSEAQRKYYRGLALDKLKDAGRMPNEADDNNLKSYIKAVDQGFREVYKDDTEYLILERPRFNSRNFQVLIRDALARGKKRILISVCRRGGKDYVALSLADIICLLRPGSNVGYLGLSLKGTKKILTSNDGQGRPMYKSVMDAEATLIATRGSTGEHFHQSVSAFKYKNGSIMYILGSDQDNELGTSLDAMVITEAARIPTASYEFLLPNVNGGMGGQGGIIIQVSTPYFGSEFNDIIDGDHPWAEEYDKHVIPATELYNADGTRVYPERELTRIRGEMAEESFEQDYMCSTKSINKQSILGKALKRAKMYPFRDRFFDPALRKEEKPLIAHQWYSFDLGNEDVCVVTEYTKVYGKQPIVTGSKANNQTPIRDFIDWIRERNSMWGTSPGIVDILIPFDSDQNLQGYEGKINRRKEVEKNVLPLGYQVILVPRSNQLDKLRFIRMLLSTGLLHMDAHYEVSKDWAKMMGSINFKEVAGKIQYVVDKRSGTHGDHPLDSAGYGAMIIFSDLFDEDFDNPNVVADYKYREVYNQVDESIRIQQALGGDVGPKLSRGLDISGQGNDLYR